MRLGSPYAIWSRPGLLSFPLSELSAFPDAGSWPVMPALSVAPLQRPISRNCLLTEQRAVFPQLSGLMAASAYTVTGRDRRAGAGSRGTGGAPGGGPEEHSIRHVHRFALQRGNARDHETRRGMAGDCGQILRVCLQRRDTAFQWVSCDVDTVRWPRVSAYKQPSHRTRLQALVEQLREDPAIAGVAHSVKASEASDPVIGLIQSADEFEVPRPTASVKCR